MRKELLTAGLYYSASKKSQRPHPVLRSLHPPAPESVKAAPERSGERKRAAAAAGEPPLLPAQGLGYRLEGTRLPAGGDSAPARATTSARRPKGTVRTSRPRPSVLPKGDTAIALPAPLRAACTSPASNPLVHLGKPLSCGISGSPTHVTGGAARPESWREGPLPPLCLGGGADPRHAASLQAQTPARPAQGRYLRRETLPGLSIN